MINMVALTGRLTRDPEIKQTQKGVVIANLVIAVNRSFTDQNGERQADFFRVIAFNKTAEMIQKYVFKGHLVGIEGRLQTRTYDDKNGNKQFITEVVTDKITFLETKKQAQETQQANYNQQGQQQQYQPQQGNYRPQQTQQSNVQYGQANPYANGPGQIDISDDDLPF